LISHFFNIKYAEVENLPITVYREMEVQALNIGNLYRQGEFQFETTEEEKETDGLELERAKKEYEELKRKGKIPWLKS